MGFLDQIRMAEIFPNARRLGNPNESFASPFQGGDPFEEVINAYKSSMNSIPRPINRLPDIGARMRGMESPDTQQNQPMNVIYKPGISDYQKAQLALGDRRLDLTESRDAANRGTQGERINLERQRVNIADYKAKNPNKRFIAVKGGNVMAFDPQTGEAEDTGISSGSLTDKERLDIQQTNAMTRQNDSQAFNKERDATRQTNNLALVEARGSEARKTKETPTPTVEKPLLPTQQKVDLFNKASQLVNSNPEYAKFIKLGDGNEFEIVPPGEGFFGPTGPSQQIYNAITDSIYGKPDKTQKPSKLTKPKTTAAPVTIEGERIRVQAPDGRTGTWPSGRELPKGYKKIG